MSEKKGSALRIPVLADTGNSKSDLKDLQKSLVSVNDATEELIDSFEDLTDETKAALKEQLAQAKAAQKAADEAQQAHKDAVEDVNEKRIAWREARLAVEEASEAEKRAAQDALSESRAALREAELAAEVRRSARSRRTSSISGTPARTAGSGWARCGSSTRNDGRLLINENTANDRHRAQPKGDSAPSANRPQNTFDHARTDQSLVHELTTNPLIHQRFPPGPVL